MNDFIELRSVIGTVLHRWWVVLLGALLFAGIGYAVSSAQDPVYRATTSLFVGRPIESAQLNRFDIENSLQLARIYADIARRQPILEQTIEALGLETTAAELATRVRTAVSSETQLLDISVDAGSPEEARTTADEIARQLILVSPNGMRDPDREQAQQFTRTQLERIQEKIEGGQMRMEELETELLALPASADTSDIQEEIFSLDTMMARWEASYAQLLNFINEEQPANNLAVLEPAQAGNEPIRPQVFFNTLVAAMVGMALAVGFIFLREFLNNTLRTPDEIARILGLRTLAGINQMKGADDPLLINQDAFSAAHEDYRLLRTKIQFLYADGQGHTIMVTSPGRSEGKSLTVANLGIVMAQAGFKTIIVDSNLRQPVQHDLFRLSNQEGLTHLLRSRGDDIGTYLSPTMVPNLKVLVSGALPANPSELLGSARMRTLLKTLSGMADIVLCDSSEAITVADASVLSSQVDGVLLVVERGSTDRMAALQAIVNLHDARANLIGAVLNRVKAKQRLVLFSESPRSASVNQAVEPRTQEELAYADSAGD